MKLRHWFLPKDYKIRQYKINEDDILVREVSPELDAAYEECVNALEFVSMPFQRKNSTIESLIYTLNNDTNRAIQAIAALRKARE